MQFGTTGFKCRQLSRRVLAAIKAGELFQFEEKVCEGSSTMEKKEQSNGMRLNSLRANNFSVSFRKLVPETRAVETDIPLEMRVCARACVELSF